MILGFGGVLFFVVAMAGCLAILNLGGGDIGVSVPTKHNGGVNLARSRGLVGSEVLVVLVLVVLATTTDTHRVEFCKI